MNLGLLDGLIHALGYRKGIGEGIAGVATVNDRSGIVTLAKGDVGLGNVTNVAQLPASYLDTATTLAANSDVKVASQKATKAYVDAAVAGVSGGASEWGDLGGTLADQTDLQNALDAKQYVSNLSSDIAADSGSTAKYPSVAATEAAIAAGVGSGAEILAAPRTYYVRTDGDDANTGLADDAGHAFSSIARAVAAIGTFDFNNDPAAYATIWLEPGATFQGQLNLGSLRNPAAYPQGLFDPFTYYGIRSAIIRSDPLNPAVIQAAPGESHCVQAAGVNALWCLDGLTLDLSTHGANFGEAIRTRMGAWVEAGNANYLLKETQSGNSIAYDTKFAAPYECDVSISGDFQSFLAVAEGSSVDWEVQTLTLIGTPAIGGSFLSCSDQSNALFAYDSLVGSATGRRFDVSYLSRINVFGAGPDYVPGDVAGTVDATTFGTYE